MIKNAIVIFISLGLVLSGAAQGVYVEDWNPDADGDGNVGVTDLLALLRQLPCAFQTTN